MTGSRLDVIGVEGLAEEQLAGEGARWSFAHDHLGAIGCNGGPLGLHRQDVLLDGEVDRGGVHAGEVEVDIEGVALTLGDDRHGARPSGGAEDLLGQAVEVPERVGPHQHLLVLLPRSNRRTAGPQALPIVHRGASVMITITAQICKVQLR